LRLKLHDYESESSAESRYERNASAQFRLNQFNFFFLISFYCTTSLITDYVTY